MPVTKEWLRQIANPQSFSKGESYYKRVDDLVKQGKTYSAIVFGSEEYTVRIIDKDKNVPLASCNCPYDLDGACKHIVAVGLNIIDGNYEEDDDNDYVEGITNEVVVLPTTTFYDDFFMTKDKSLRKAFLRQLFANDDKLRRQFFAFSQPKTEFKPQMVEDGLIEKTTKRLAKKLDKLSELDVDDFYSRGRGRYNDYYDDDGSDVQEWADEKITEVFTSFETEIKQNIQNGTIISTTQMLIGLYEGCLGVEFHGDIGDYMGDDFKSVALEKLSELIDRQSEVLKTTIFHENDIKTSILLLLNRWIKRKDSIESIGFFENYFIELSHQSAVAKWLIKESQERKLTLKLIYLTLANANTVKDNELWFKSAESVAYEDTTVMQMLLDKYLALGRLTEFHKVGKAALSKFEHNHFVSYLKIRVLEKYDSDLYIDVHLKNAIQTGALDDFLAVHPLLSKRKEVDFIEKCKKDKPNLYVDILNKDGNFEKILHFLEDKKTSQNTYISFSYGFDMPKALGYIIEKYPDEVFNIVQFQTEEALGCMKMDRSGYARAIAYLRPLINLPQGNQQNAKNYMLTLRSRYMGRPAFLDELSKIGLNFK